MCLLVSIPNKGNKKTHIVDNIYNNLIFLKTQYIYLNIKMLKMNL